MGADCYCSRCALCSKIICFHKKSRQPSTTTAALRLNDLIKYVDCFSELRLGRNKRNSWMLPPLTSLQKIFSRRTSGCGCFCAANLRSWSKTKAALLADLVWDARRVAKRKMKAAVQKRRIKICFKKDVAFSERAQDYLSVRLTWRAENNLLGKGKTLPVVLTDPQVNVCVRACVCV